MEEVYYFEIDEFKMDLNAYLNFHTGATVTAMCPVCKEHMGFTSGIYVTIKKEE
jgi:hypothetical protein